MNELALFAGAGGGILGGLSLGWRTICAVEIEPYAAGILVARQNEGALPPFPVWDDVCTFDGRPWRGRVDVISGGFPCQDISDAGTRRGLAGAKSGLWSEFARIIGEVRPSLVFVENSPALTHKGLEVVLGDLAAMGFNAEWGVLGASEVGAPHARERFWLVAHTNQKAGGLEPGLSWGAEAQVSEPPVPGQHAGWDLSTSPQPLLGRMANGVAPRVVSNPGISALGNGQVPQCMARAYALLMQRLVKSGG